MAPRACSACFSSRADPLDFTICKSAFSLACCVVLKFNFKARAWDNCSRNLSSPPEMFEKSPWDCVSALHAMELMAVANPPLGSVGNWYLVPEVTKWRVSGLFRVNGFSRLLLFCSSLLSADLRLLKLRLDLGTIRSSYP